MEHIEIRKRVASMEKQRETDLRLTEEQLAEVRRRRTEKDPTVMSLAEFNERLCRRYSV